MKKYLTSSAFAIIAAAVPLTSMATSMINSGFEGGLTGWTTPSGNESNSVSTVTSHNGYTAPDGDNFAVITGGCQGNELIQEFSAQAGEKIYGWSFFEANDWGGVFNDEGKVKLILDDGISEITLFAADHVSGGGLDWTPWNFTFPADGIYSLRAISTNVGDCIVDSVVGLDIAENTTEMSSGIILTRTGVEDDKAQFKLIGVEDIGIAATTATELTVEFGGLYPGDEPIYSFSADATEIDAAGNRMIYSDMDGINLVQRSGEISFSAII
ncbi:MAG: hypothetical protein D3923_15575 [Candidatus Electrothrix sp. AR3]|nr:hypothetical protein [Candidatus Electrothrix sp. AR3]